MRKSINLDESSMSLELGGEHFVSSAVSGGLLLSLKKQLKLWVVWLDGHCQY